MNPELPADQSVERLILTPAGALHAFSREKPDRERSALQSVLAARTLPHPQQWATRGAEHEQLLAQGIDRGWLQIVHRELRAPDLRLADLFSHLVAGLSGEGRAALASVGGFCIGHAGYSTADAEALCVAAADYNEFGHRQRARGWQGASDMVSFHHDLSMLIPVVSFVPFWVDGFDYCLVIGGEPLLNNPTFVEMLWGIKAAGSKYTERVPKMAAALRQSRARREDA